MRKYVILTLFAALFAVISNAAIFPENNDVAGEWKYEVPNAPYGYRSGVISISENEDGLSGEVKFSDGYKVKLKKITLDGNSLHVELYIDYELITVKSDVKDNAMKGVVNTPDGNMNLTAEKIK
jgi:hypothetical protein